MRETPSRGHTWRAPMDFSLSALRRSLGPPAAELGQEVVQMIVTRIADDQFPRTFFARPDLDFGADLLGQFFLEARDVAVGPASAPGFDRGMKDGVDHALRLAHGERLVCDPLRGALLLPSVEREKRARVSHFELSVENKRLDRLLKIQ